MKFPILAATLRLFRPNHSVKKVSAAQVSGLTLYDKIEEIVSIANSRGDTSDAITMFYGLTKVQRQITLVALIEHNMLRALELILKTGFDVNFLIRGRSLLHFAIKSKNIEMVRSLLKYKADIECKNKHDETALSYAVRKGNDLIVRCLLKHGAKLRASSSDSTILPGLNQNEIESNILLENQRAS